MATAYLRTVLLPIDSSQKSKLAFDHYCNHLHKEGDVAILLHVYVMPKMYDVNTPWPAVKDLIENWNYYNMVKENEADALLQEYENLCKEKSLFYKTNRVAQVLENSDKIGEKICEFLKENKADMIVMNYSSKGDKDGDPGSTCRYCVENAGIPVEVLYL